VFPVRYGLNLYILFTRNQSLKDQSYMNYFNFAADIYIKNVKMA
jgi:hypothetical protein